VRFGLHFSKIHRLWKLQAIMFREGTVATLTFDYCTLVKTTRHENNRTWCDLVPILGSFGTSMVLVYDSLAFEGKMPLDLGFSLHLCLHFFIVN